ncbi:hypothetical protein VTK56DRAFT_8826 [Thermocarpiscus australiensis]
MEYKRSHFQWNLPSSQRSIANLPPVIQLPLPRKTRGISIRYEHITITSLSLPIPATLTILTIFLPLLSAFTTLTIPLLFHPPPSSKSRPKPKSASSSLFHLPRLLPLSLQLFQFLLTTILATLFTAPLAARQSTARCLLETEWRALWSAHDAARIRAVQDAFACCGFRSTRDMAWPFPGGGTVGTGACEAQFGRRVPCLGFWEGALRRGLGAEVGVVVSIGVMQVLAVYLAGRFGVGMGMGGSGGGERGWMRVVRRVWGGGEDRVGAGSRRPLLAAPERERVAETGYDGRADEEDAVGLKCGMNIWVDLFAGQVDYWVTEIV